MWTVCQIWRRQLRNCGCAVGLAAAERLELAIVGQNLIDAHHPEFATPALRKEIPRAIFGKVSWSF